MPEYKALAQRLKAIRKALKQNQEEFSWNCGISKEQLSLMERSKANVTLDVLQRIAAYTGLTVSDLVKVQETQADKKAENNKGEKQSQKKKQGGFFNGFAKGI